MSTRRVPISDCPISRTLAERILDGLGKSILTSDLSVPNRALYQGLVVKNCSANWLTTIGNPDASGSEIGTVLID